MDNARPRASKLAQCGRADRSRRSQVIRQLMLVIGAGLVVAAGAEPAAATGWSVQTPPRPVHLGETELDGVSCTSTSDCVAVGLASVASTGAIVPLALRWNGYAWSVERTPIVAAPDSYGSLSGVSCVSKDACIAVGVLDGGPLAERWNGSSWSIQSTAVADAYELDGVSCSSSTTCVAVGSSGQGPIAERWDGRRWSAQNTRSGGVSDTESELLAVSCPSHTTCAAVGDDDVGLCGLQYDYGSGGADYYVPVFGSWTSGRWSLLRHPNIACSNSSDVGGGNGLDAVSCTSPTACTAVGSQVYRWNGSRWSTQRAPLRTDPVSGISCTSTKACTAVGSDIYAWKGGEWSSEPIPLPPHATTATLTSVSCTTPGSCVAVGDYYSRAGDELALVESIGVGTPGLER